MRTEDDIRSALATLADDVPQPEQVLAAVRTAGRGRQRRRRTVIVLAVATTAIAAIAVPITGKLLGDGRSDSVQPAVDPVPTRPANDSWRHRFALDLPDGFEVHVSRIEPNREIIVIGGPSGQSCMVGVFAPGQFDAREIPAERTPITVQGRQGFYATVYEFDGSRPRVAWQYANNSWALVACRDSSGESADASLRLANSLTFGPGRVPAPFAVTYLPAGVVVDGLEPLIDAGGDTFKAHAEQRPRVALGSARLEIQYLRRTSPTATVTPLIGPSQAGPRSLTINGRVATLTTDPDGAALVITGDGFQAQVSARRLADAADEVVRIAEGLTFAPDPAEASTWFDAAEALP
jgi:hypothetical protein